VNKTVRILLALGLILAIAAPAFAEFKLNGYYRLMGYNQEWRSGDKLSATSVSNNAKDEDGDSKEWIDQRMRLMATYTLNDSVAVVYFAEVDSMWGERYGTTNGAQLAGDSVNVETKNAYLDLKSGDFVGRLGLQGIADPYEGVLFNDDMAGVTAGYKMNNTSLNLIYAKLYEDDRSDYDDTDFYGLGVSQKVSDTFKIGANVYYLDINDIQSFDNAGGQSTTGTGNGNQDYWPGPVINSNDRTTAEVISGGVNADAKFGNFGLSGFAVYQDLSLEANNASFGSPAEIVDGDADGNAWLATVKASYKMENGDVGLRFLYVSPNDDEDGADQWIGNFGQYEFPNENLMQFMVDKFVLNSGKERYGFNDAVFEGYGLMALMASGNHKLPNDMYLNWGAGYFMAADEKAKGASGNFGERQDEVTGEKWGDDNMGWEVALRIGKKFFEKVDVSLNGSYADYGDFYECTAPKDGVANDGDPDATYKTYLMVNVPF
jgi:hypothetical protein